jgi:surface protein
MFNGYYSLTSIPLFDTSNVSDMYGMFYCCSSLTSLPILNTSNVSNISEIFGACYSLPKINQVIFFINTKKGFKLNNIIKITTKYKLRDIILSGEFDNSIQIKNTEHICCDGTIYDYSSIIDLSYMFDNCYFLTSIPLFDTSNVTNMNNMFKNCYKLKTIPLFNTFRVLYAQEMFDSCSSLVNLPLFDFSSLKNMRSMFSYCYSLTSIPDFNTKSVVNLDYFLFDCKKITLLPKFNLSSLIFSNLIFSNTDFTISSKIIFLSQNDPFIINSLPLFTPLDFSKYSKKYSIS